MSNSIILKIKLALECCNDVVKYMQLEEEFFSSYPTEYKEALAQLAKEM